MPEQKEEQWVSSIEVMKATGISRATLNNYIRFGIIPRPVIRKPDDPGTKTKKVGFFPQDVIGRLESVKRLKMEGHVMDDIIDHLKDLGSAVSSQKREAIISKKRGEQGTLFKDEIPAGQSIDREKLQLTIDDIGCPAYLINNNFEIDWINEEAEEIIFKREIRLIREATLRNIFKLFFNTRWQKIEQNQMTFIEFHMNFIRSRYSKADLSKLFDGITEREISILEEVYDRDESSSREAISDHYFNLVCSDGTESSFHVYHIVFREGILFVYAPAEGMLKGIVELLSSRGRLVNEVLKQRMPTLTTFCVLVADLQSSTRICAELPPEEYFELINQIWKRMEGTFKKFYGTYGKHVGDGMVYYFLKDKDSNYIMNAISCALELRGKMKVLSMEWKLRKGWSHDLNINIGINEGQEYFWTIPASPNIEFTALGDSVNHAGRLSDFSRYGEIWTTKNLINKLNLEERRKVRYGIIKKEQDRDVFVENIFSRIMDLVDPENPSHSKFMDVATLPVTQVLDWIL